MDPFNSFAASPLPHGLDLVAITPSDTAVLDPMPRALRLEVFEYAVNLIPTDLAAWLSWADAELYKNYATVRVTPARAASDDMADSILLRFPVAKGNFGFALHELPCRIRKVWATGTSDNVSITGLV